VFLLAREIKWGTIIIAPQKSPIGSQCGHAVHACKTNDAMRQPLHVLANQTAGTSRRKTNDICDSQKAGASDGMKLNLGRLKCMPTDRGSSADWLNLRKMHLPSRPAPAKRHAAKARCAAPMLRACSSGSVRSRREQD